MISAVFTSQNLSRVSLVDLEHEVASKFGEADYLMFAIHPNADMQEYSAAIRDIFQTEKFMAFHVLDHFNNNQIKEEVISVCAIKFEKNASINEFYIEDISSKESLQKVTDYFNNNSNKFHFILAGVCDGQMGSFVETFSTKLNYSPIDNIVGGVSSGMEVDGEFRTYQFIDNKIIKNGLVVLSFSNMDTHVDVSLGFKPYGITYEITKAEGNRLYNIDDGKNFSYMIKKMLSGIDDKNDVRSLWYAPLTILSEEDGYMLTLRTVQKISDRYAEFFAPLNNGDHFKLSFATYEDLIEEDEKTAKRLIGKVPNPELSFNFSCIARQYVLEDKQSQEIQTYVDNFNTTLFGFFTFGEIGPDKMFKRLKFYNETSLAVVMREK